MSISPQQLAANRANAAKSTGPTTPEGKTRSAQNAIKHGFTGSSFVVVRLEELPEVDLLKEDLVAYYQPENSQEMVAIERMALAQQSMRRAQRLESGLLTASLNETLDTNDHAFTPMSSQLAGEGDMDITRAQNRNYCLAEGFLRQIRQSNGWSLFLRYQAQSERLYRRAVEEFERLKALRPVACGSASVSERPGTVSVSERPGTVSVSERPNEPISHPQPEESTAPSPVSQTNPSGRPARRQPIPARNAIAPPRPASPGIMEQIRRKEQP